MMSLIPAFEIGLWNAWILMLPYVLLLALFMLIRKDAFKKTAVIAPHNRTGKISLRFYELSFPLAFIYSVFLPLKLGTAWFYTGLPIYILGLIIGIIAIVNVASTPLGKLFTEGVYHYSRNPMYLCMIILFVSIGIASASWFYLLLSAIFIVMAHFMAVAEERLTLDKLGDAYREYMNRTPRWIGIPKSMESD